MDHKTSQVTESVNRVLITTLFLLGQLFCSARDTIEYGFPIQDNGETLVSAGEAFEMGFFTPYGISTEKRYVGIWYKSFPDTIVWVANRDYPVLPGSNATGVFGIREDGNLQVLGDNGGKSLWSTKINETLQSPNMTTAKLMDSGNLILSLLGKESLWESFKDPTDTFLPGMEMVPGLKLSSWRERDDPGTRGFVFKLDDQARETQYSIMNGSVPYWRSGVKFTGSDKIPYLILYILSNFTLQMPNSTSRRDYSGMRLAIMSDGTFNAYQKLGDGENVNWYLIWSVPPDACSISNACGSFGICVANDDYDNDMNTLVCKCLPGFKPTYPDMWGSRDFSGGCTKRTQPCGDSFLKLPMMDLKKPESPDFPVSNETECMENCRRNCRCKAFSFSPPEEEVYKRDTGSNPGQCSIWIDTLQGLEEGYAHGRNLSVRVASSDLESTKRNCAPCGTNIVPYPLSTGPGCGDPTYFNFHCNHSNIMLTFKVHGGDYKVLSINPDTRRFLIEVHRLDNCGARNEIFGLSQSSPFNVSNWCYPSSRVSARSTRIVEIGWDPPQEPTCGSDSDCKEWSNASCNSDTKRCRCNLNYRWDSLTLNCTRIQGDGANSESDVPLQPVEQLPSKKNTSLPLIVVPTVLSIALLACTFICFIIVRRRKISKQNNSRRSDQTSKEFLKLDTQKHIDHLINTGEFEKKDEEGIDVPFISFDSIIEATNGFSEANKLGQGGYGPVYKGVFSGSQEIAVKRLSSVSGQGLEEFKNEVVLIAKLQHRNLVRLRGYCMKGDEKILLYEYMPNTSLDAFIFDDKKSVILDWEKRFSIILGIARGLLYLHQDSRLRIIHRDLKTSNILLDQEMEPKISDFGLARIVGGKQTEANTNRVVGTFGYISPEYALEGLFSVKSDVFSFGVVLLEIISGKRNTRLVQSEPRLSLLGYAWRVWTENNAMELIDPCLAESCKEDQFLKCVKVGLLCVQEDPSERPTMSSIVTMLDSESASVPNPQQPAFVLKRGYNVASSSSSSKPDETHGEITATLDEGR